jgi:hypothetical protein
MLGLFVGIYLWSGRILIDLLGRQSRVLKARGLIHGTVFRPSSPFFYFFNKKKKKLKNNFFYLFIIKKAKRE